MKVAMLSSEVVPYSKTGGLADVVGALPKYISRAGAEVAVFSPFYRETKKKNLSLERVAKNIPLKWAGKDALYSIWVQSQGSLSFFFIEKDEYFDRDYLYGSPQGDYPDNAERFAFFCRSVLDALKVINFQPEVLHCHDWQSALALAYLKFAFPDDQFFAPVRSLFTIHNLAYQ